MSIHEIYEAETMSQAMDISEHNCTVCMKRCSNMRCPNMQALMNKSEQTEMDADQKKRYFTLVGA